MCLCVGENLLTVVVGAQDTWKETAFTIKGTTMQKPPPKCIAHCVQAPKKLLQLHDNVHLHCDIVCACEIVFMTSMSDVPHHRSTAHISDGKEPTLRSHSELTLQKCKNAGCAVNKVTTDPESEPVFGDFSRHPDCNIDFQCVTAQGHVSPAECNHQTIKTQCQSACHGTTFEALPIIMLISMVIDQVMKLNFL